MSVELVLFLALAPPLLALLMVLVLVLGEVVIALAVSLVVELLILAHAKEDFNEVLNVVEVVIYC